MADEDPDEARLDEVIRELDSMPPDVVRQAILDAGLIEPALTALADLARSAEDPDVREQARRYIDQNGLGLLLFADDTDAD